ncbi:hypothetical protein [Ferruginibacter sp.]
MTKKMLFLHGCLLLLSAGFGQLKLTPQQKKADSISFEKFRKNYPDEFEDNRPPTQLLDGSYSVAGYSSVIQLTNNHIKDKVYHNFHPGMPDTSTVNPYNDIKITDAGVQLNFFYPGFASGPASFDAYITPVNRSFIKNNRIDGAPVNIIQKNMYSIRLSINGKLIYDWKPLNSFKETIYKSGSKWKLPNSTDIGESFEYGQGWAICDTTININDQLLIEVKNDNNNWMVDRYNITRVAVSPTVSAVTGMDNKIIADSNSLEKKTSR